MFVAILCVFIFCFNFVEVLRLIIHRRNKIFHPHSKQGQFSWVTYHANFIIDWKRDSTTSHESRSVHPCYLWLSNYFLEQKYFAIWYKEVKDNIRPSNDNYNYNENNDDIDHDNKDNTNINDNNNNTKNNKNENNYSYAWFKMNCFMSVAFNCTRYAFSFHQTQAANALLQVCIM